MTDTISGLWPPLATPFQADGSVDHARLVAHGKWLLAEGSSGLAPLGTTSEANSLTLAERMALVDALIAGGIAPGQLIPGNGACAVEDVVTFTRHVSRAGVRAVLMLPPFYYKGVPDEGIYAFFGQVIERLGADVPKFLLYHFPAMAGVGFSHELVGRLAEAYPEIIVGAKDSTGDKPHTLSLIENFPDLAIFPGTETFLAEAVERGAAGCISLSANINPAGVAALQGAAGRPDAEALQATANAIRATVAGPTQISAMKAVLAALKGDDAWRATRPPLVPLDDKARKALLAMPAIADLVSAARQPA